MSRLTIIIPVAIIAAIVLIVFIGDFDFLWNFALPHTVYNGKSGSESAATAAARSSTAPSHHNVVDADSHNHCADPAVTSTDTTAQILGVSGVLFSGQVLRTYDGVRLFQTATAVTAAAGHTQSVRPTPEPSATVTNVTVAAKSYAHIAQATGFPEADSNCRRWGVSTTIFKPTDAYKKFIGFTQREKDLCFVIVLDRKTPHPYPARASKRVIVLTAQIQEKLAASQLSRKKGSILEFVQHIPWNHFGRKVLGYAYVVMQSHSQSIWDFDDDNIVVAHKAPTAPPRSKLWQIQPISSHECSAFNPYPMMGCTTEPCWPRGLPLPLIKRKDCSVAKHVRPDAGTEPAIIQSLANHDPDVDAIYRLTQPLPFNFAQVTDLPVSQTGMLLPAGTYAPFNAQATLWLQKSFWGLMLPITVHGRVSDIWRSYIVQRLLFDTKYRLAFVPALVTQDRNAHNYLGDLKAEDDLYQRSGALLTFLASWTPSKQATSLPARFEELIIALFERGYVEQLDVTTFQLWLQFLVSSGYQFPAIGTVPVAKKPRSGADSSPLSNVLLLASFNYGYYRNIPRFLQLYSPYFRNIALYGPKANGKRNIQSDRDMATKYNVHINAIGDGQSDAGGYFSYMLAVRAMQDPANANFTGIFFMHDDALVFPCNLHTFPLDQPWKTSNGNIRSTPRSWPHYNTAYGITAWRNVQADPNMTEFLPVLEHCFAPHNIHDALLARQSDVWYVPRASWSRFIKVANIMYRHRLFLEVATPALLKCFIGEEISLPFRTSWSGRLRGSTEFARTCFNADPNLAVVHPMKLSKPDVFKASVELLQKKACPIQHH
jgi:STELLO glycosyltransferases